MPRYQFPSTFGPLPSNSAAHYPSVLEMDYPHILRAIQALWGYAEMNRYFDRLTIDSRGGRAGLPTEAWDEIYLLMGMHLLIVPSPS